MKFIKYKEFQKLIEAGHERRDLEFKSPFAWKKIIDPIQGQNIKSIICLSNLRFGGVLIIGIRQRGKLFKVEGLTESKYSSFKDFEAIKGQVDSFIYDETIFEIEWTKNKKGRFFIVFRISSFEDYPLITKNDLVINSHKFIIKDRIYSRTKQAPYASKIAGPSELKEIIDTSADKNIKILQSRGLVTSSPSDQDLFDKQKKDLFE